MHKTFAPPYFSERTRRLLTLGFVPVVGLGIAEVEIRGGGTSVAILLLYAAFLALATGKSGWRSASVSYNEHPVVYFVFVFTYLVGGVTFLII
jgi:hypothetical protein